MIFFPAHFCASTGRTSILFRWLFPTKGLPVSYPTLLLFQSSQSLPPLLLLSALCRHTPPDLPFTASQQTTIRPTATLKTLYYWKKNYQLQIHLFTIYITHIKQDKKTTYPNTTMIIHSYTYYYYN